MISQALSYELLTQFRERWPHLKLLAQPTELGSFSLFELFLSQHLPSASFVFRPVQDTSHTLCDFI